jgi:membrane protein implicated in regulation of membrane protease activity
MEAQWLLWLALALAAGVAEIFTLSLVFAMVVGASTGLLLAGVRPPLLHYAGRVGPGSGTGVAALVGREAVVLREVSEATGEVKLAGETWTARADRPDEILETGSLVIVTRIDGATARVTASRGPHPPRIEPVSPDPQHDPAALPGGEPPTDRPES